MPMKSVAWKMELMALTWLEICRDNRWDDVKTGDLSAFIFRKKKSSDVCQIPIL